MQDMILINIDAPTQGLASAKSECSLVLVRRRQQKALLVQCKYSV